MVPRIIITLTTLLSYPSEVLAIKLASAGEQYGSGRHVQAHGKCLSRKQCLQHTGSQHWMNTFYMTFHLTTFIANLMAIL